MNLEDTLGIGAGAAGAAALSMLTRMMHKGYRKHWLADDDQRQYLFHPLDAILALGGAGGGAFLRAKQREHQLQQQEDQKWQP